MNLSSYLADTGMSNSSRLATTEINKQRMQNLLALEQEKAQGQAIGGLVGSLLGAGAGAVQSYNSDENSADAARGFQSRQDYNNLTDSSRPASQRISSVYGPEAAEIVNQRAQPIGPVSDAYNKGVARSNAWRDEAAAATTYQPRLSYRHQLLVDNPGLAADPRSGAAAVPGSLDVNGRTVREVPNDPRLDYEALNSKDLDAIFNPLYDRIRDFSVSRFRRY